MPSKPPELLVRHDTKADKAERARVEAALRPAGQLPRRPPARLADVKGKDGRVLIDHSMARAAWGKLLKIYGELEAVIATKLDIDMLTDYCILSEQAFEMDKVRQQAQAAVVESGDTEEAIKALEMVTKVDARVDRKRALLHQFRQSLYLTPRTRAGVAAATRKPPEPEDELERMLRGVDLEPDVQ